MNQSDIEKFNEGFHSGEYAAMVSVIRHCVYKLGGRGEDVLRLLLAEIEAERKRVDFVIETGGSNDCT